MYSSSHHFSLNDVAAHSSTIAQKRESSTWPALVRKTHSATAQYLNVQWGGEKGGGECV